MNLVSLIDQAVAEALAAHGDYLTPRGKEADRARKLIVRKVTKALRDSMLAPREEEPEGDAPATQEPEKQAEYWQCEVWSKEWWALLFAKIERKQLTGFMLEQAIKSQRGSPWSVPFDQQPPHELIDRMRCYPSDGKAVEAWRHWLARKGVRLPEWRNKVWVFLPDPEPPVES